PQAEYQAKATPLLDELRSRPYPYVPADDVQGKDPVRALRHRERHDQSVATRMKIRDGRNVPSSDQASWGITEDGFIASIVSRHLRAEGRSCPAVRDTVSPRADRSAVPRLPVPSPCRRPLRRGCAPRRRPSRETPRKYSRKDRPRRGPRGPA